VAWLRSDRMRRCANSARLLLAAAAFGALGCGEDSTTTDSQPFAVRFAAMAAGVPAGCTTEVAGLGPAGDRSIGLSDLRFYVSNLQLFDASGVKLEITLDQDEFQYTSSAGSVALVDSTGNVEGSCSGTAATAAEGTARTHEAITGLARGGAVTSIAFDVGVPQSLMRDTISAYSPRRGLPHHSTRCTGTGRPATAISS